MAGSAVSRCGGPAGDLATVGGEIESALREPQGGEGCCRDRADEGALCSVSPLWLPSDQDLSRSTATAMRWTQTSLALVHWAGLQVRGSILTGRWTRRRYVRLESTGCAAPFRDKFIEIGCIYLDAARDGIGVPYQRHSGRR